MLGLPFFFQQYVVFHAANKQIGVRRKGTNTADSHTLAQSVGLLEGFSCWLVEDRSVFSELWIWGVAIALGVAACGCCVVWAGSLRPKDGWIRVPVL